MSRYFQCEVIDHVTQLLSDLHNECEVTFKLGDMIDHVTQLQSDVIDTVIL